MRFPFRDDRKMKFAIFLYSGIVCFRWRLTTALKCKQENKQEWATHGIDGIGEMEQNKFRTR
jgi:hypothetical protein